MPKKSFSQNEHSIAKCTFLKFIFSLDCSFAAVAQLTTQNFGHETASDNFSPEKNPKYSYFAYKFYYDL